MAVRGAGGRFHFLLRRIRLAHADVVRHGIGEQVHVLEHDGHLLGQRVGRDIAHLVPATRTLPLLASQNREIKLMTVVFPLPEGPTSAVRVPGCAVNVTPCSTSLPSAYPNRTSSNRTSKLVKRGLPSRYARGRSACIRSMPSAALAR